MSIIQSIRGIVPIQMLFRIATHTKQKNEIIDKRMKEIVNDFHVVSRENYFKTTTSVFIC